MTGTAQGQGTETIYNPNANTSIFATGAMDDARDESDAASVVIYFIHPTPSHIQAVAKAIRASSNANPSSSLTNNPFDQSFMNTSSSSSRAMKHRIVFLPRINALSKRILADEQIIKRKDVAVHTLDVNLIPIEDDVLTCLDMDSTMMDCHVNGLPSEHVTHVAQSLRKIQDVCGTIPRMQSFGQVGEMVLERMMALRLEEYDAYSEHDGNGNGNGNGDGQEENPEIWAGIVLDRRVDLVTPLVTPLTYEGLLDDVLKIEAG